MKFGEFLNSEDPAYEVFNAAMDIVFDKGDGRTQYLDRLSPEARVVYLLWCFDGEVHNGGFDQLFTNSLGNHCLEILQYLLEIKATKSHALLSSAISWFPNSNPAQDRNKRWDQYETFSNDQKYQPAIDHLDAEFYKYEDNLNLLINSYVSEHPAATISA